MQRDLDRVVETLSADIRAVGVTAERVESTVRMLAEGLVSTREQLERKIDGVDERLSARIAVLEDVVRQSSAALRHEVGELRLQLVQRERLDELDTRVTAVEKRVGIVPGK